MYSQEKNVKEQKDIKRIKKGRDANNDRKSKNKSESHSKRKSKHHSKSKSESRSKSKSKRHSESRSRSQSSNKKNSNETKVLEQSREYNVNFSYLSKEAKKVQTYHFNPIEINPPNQETHTLFQRKSQTISFLQNIKDKDITIIKENEATLDNTLHEIHKLKLYYNINKINDDAKLLDEIKDDIAKSAIVLSEEEYNQQLERIANKDLKSSLKYKHYKSNIIKCIESLLNYNENTCNYDEYGKNAREILDLDKDYEFNNSTEISEDNLYYYQLSKRFYMIIPRILEKFVLYKDLLTTFKEFLEQNELNKIKEDQINYYQILNYYLTDKEALKDQSDVKMLKELLTNNYLSIEEINKKVNEINSYQYTIPKIRLNINNNYLEFKCIKKHFLKGQKIEEEFFSKFEINSFNKLFKNINIDNLTKSCDSELYECLIYSKMKNNNIINKLLPYLKKAIMQITKSEAMKKFFNDTYKRHYNNLVYDFEKEEVIEEFFKRISIIKLFNSTEAFSDPIDLRMYLPINTGKIHNLSFLGDIEILRFGRLLLLILHELLGHLLRRYYFYLSGGKVCRDTAQDKKMGWGNEGGEFFEKSFLGNNYHFLSIRDIISLLTPKKTYPIISEDDLTLENIKNVITEYRELFKHVSILENTDDKTTANVDKTFANKNIPNDDKTIHNVENNINNVHKTIPLNYYYEYLNVSPYTIIKHNIYSFTSFIEI